MKFFMNRIGGFDRLSLEARVIYTGFCVFALFGYATSVWLYVDSGLGASASSTRAYYRGAQEAGLGDDAGARMTGDVGSTAGADGSGPMLDLPGLDVVAGAGVEDVTTMHGAEERSLRFEKPPRQVMETLHFHLFSIPVFLLIIAHLYMMCSQSQRTKVAVLVATYGVTAVHLALPVTVRFVWPQVAGLMFWSAVGTGVLWLYITVWPLIEMWRAPLMPIVSPFEIRNGKS